MSQIENNTVVHMCHTGTMGSTYESNWEYNMM